MGRELYRVPLDFDWPIDKTWEGYEMPSHLQPAKCSFCDGTGQSEFANKLQAQWYGRALFDPEKHGSPIIMSDTPAVRRFAERQIERTPGYYGTGEVAIRREAVRLANLWRDQWCHNLNQDDLDALMANGGVRGLTHVFDREERKWVSNGFVPTLEELQAWTIDEPAWGCGSELGAVMRAACERAGVKSYCEVCDGEGGIYASVEHRGAHDSWTMTRPPEGPGYQMWQTVSDAPLSPVFETPEKLATWLDTYWHNDGDYDRWLKFINGPGWAPSAMGFAGELVGGVEAVTRD